MHFAWTAGNQRMGIISLMVQGLRLSYGIGQT